jgi:hypothetical protein
VVATAICLAGMAMFVQAQTPVTIDVSTLGEADANNSGNPAEAQWEYDGTYKQLRLNTPNGNYTLTGTNSNIAVQSAAAEMTLDNMDITTISTFNAFSVQSDNCTITLVGTNAITCELFFSFNGTNCTIISNTNGTLTGTSNNNRSFNVDGFFSITGNATVSVIGNYDMGLLISKDGIINVGANATLNVTGKNEAIWGIYHDFTFNCDGTAILGCTDTYCNGIRADGATVTITGSGTVSTAGEYYGIFLGSGVLEIEDCSVTAEGNLGVAIYTTNNIKMNDAAKLTMKPGINETNTFEKSNPTSTYKWELTNATTTDPLTNAVISVTVAAGETGTVKRVSATGINEIAAENATVTGYFDILGRNLQEEPTKGIYIIRYNNGKTKKIMR